MKLFLGVSLLGLSMAFPTHLIQLGPDGRLRPISSLQMQNFSAVLGETFAPGSRTATCPLTPVQIEEALSIIDNTMGYLQGAMHAYSTTQREALLATRLATCTGIENLLSDDNRIKLFKFMLLNFQDNLLYLSNTIKNCLTDDHKKDVTYRQLIREIASVNHWFDSVIIPGVLCFEPMSTLKTIFKDLSIYFPSTNTGFGGMFALANGVTTIDRIDAVYIGFAESFSAREQKAWSQFQSAGRKKNQQKQEICNRLNTAIEQMIADPMREVELFNLVDPYCKRKSFGLNWRDKYLKHHQVVLDLKMVPDSDSCDESPSGNADDRNVEQLSVAAANAASVEGVLSFGNDEEDVAQEQNLAPPVKIPHQYKSMAAAAAAVSVVGGEAADAASTDDDNVLNPRTLHQKHMFRKQTATVAADADFGSAESLNSAHPNAQRFYGFVNECIYGRTTFTWKDFKREFNRVGFLIQGIGNGNVRQVSLGGKKFTVHRPNNETDFVPYDYIHHIQSGLSYVFGLTAERVQGLLSADEA